MKDINIIIKDALNKDFVVNTKQIEEDVLRIKMGLDPQEQDGE